MLAVCARLSYPSARDPSAGGDDDLLPRESIGDQITNDLLAKFESEQWKDRMAALEEVSLILVSVGGKIKPNGLGDLIAAIKVCTADCPNRAPAKTCFKRPRTGLMPCQCCVLATERAIH